LVVADILVTGTDSRLGRMLMVELRARGHVPAQLQEAAPDAALGRAQAVVNTVRDTSLMRQVVDALARLPAERRPLALIEGSGDGACRAAAAAAQRLGVRVVLIETEVGLPAAHVIGLMVHAVRAWDLTGRVDRGAAERSGYFSCHQVAEGGQLVGASR